MNTRQKVALAAAIVGIPIIAYGLRVAFAIPRARLFMHVKHDPASILTKGRLSDIYGLINRANKTGLPVGLFPQCIADWSTQLEYLGECRRIPTMLSVFSSSAEGVGPAYMLTVDQVGQALGVAAVQCLSIFEAITYYRDVLKEPFPTGYVSSILDLARDRRIPVVWSEWDINVFPQIANYIIGYEDNVLVSFGTNSNQVEPSVGFGLLQDFARRAASVQSWYWFTRHDNLPGSEMDMPPDLMVQHTREALQAGCEIVEYEPYWYFFDGTTPRVTLDQVLGASML